MGSWNSSLQFYCASSSRGGQRLEPLRDGFIQPRCGCHRAAAIRGEFPGRIVDLREHVEILQPRVGDFVRAGFAGTKTLFHRGIVSLGFEKKAGDAPLFEGVREQVAMLDLEYHITLAQATHNEMISLVYEPVIEYLRQQLLLAWQRYDRSPEVFNQQHQALSEAVRDHDPTRARAAMTAHLDYARELLDRFSSTKGDHHES